MLEKSGDDWKTADNNADSHLGPGPQAHRYQVVADIGRLGNFPGVVCSQDRRHAGSKHAKRISACSL